MEVRTRLRDQRQRLLLQWAHAGSEAAFRQLYRELCGPVMGYLAARIRPREEAEDLCSQIFMRFLQRLDQYDGDRGSVLSWILSMSRNALIDRLRSLRPTSSLDENFDAVDPSPDPLDRIVEGEEARFVHGVLANHPAELRELYSLRFAHGLRYAEIGEMLGISEAAVKQRFSRSLRELRSTLEQRNEKGGANHADWKAQRNPQGSA
ncbi:MAG TPA: sigma-70 family RNA polymerase sigma factor [Candidatus Krumholzibacteria bacterium]